MDEGIRVNGREFDAGSSITIGRNPSCDVVFTNPIVSATHATLALELGMWTFTDSGSTNGSYVGGVRVGTLPVHERVVVMLGHPVEGSELTLETAVAAEPAPAPVPDGAPFPAPPPFDPAPDQTAPLAPVAPLPVAEQPAPLSPVVAQPAPLSPVVAQPAPLSPPAASVGTPPDLAARVHWAHGILRTAGVLELRGDRVSFATERKGALFDVSVAEASPHFPPSEMDEVVEIRAAGTTYRLHFVADVMGGVPGNNSGRETGQRWRHHLTALYSPDGGAVSMPAMPGGVPSSPGVPSWPPATAPGPPPPPPAQAPQPSWPAPPPPPGS
jgi:FHA domain